MIQELKEKAKLTAYKALILLACAALITKGFIEDKLEKDE